MAVRASRGSKIAFLASSAWCILAIGGVHWLQIQERESMYQGVVKDEARMAAKKKQREEELLESMKKREVYEKFQPVGQAAPS
ncbi:hypothetical protein FRC03_007820 [Tulasnella sp. 419]|nr:hypothetical protein FRC02_011221 [Tulasnella sp. 418]KAG8937840.1 hypothetical protein FRC03_007820 [Tulasnella sp. 419]